MTHRHIKNNRLANTGRIWAFAASASYPPAPAHYWHRREVGDRHGAGTRHLFNKLLGQLHRCLQAGQTFNQAKAFPSLSGEAAAGDDD